MSLATIGHRFTVPLSAIFGKRNKCRIGNEHRAFYQASSSRRLVTQLEQTIRTHHPSPLNSLSIETSRKVVLSSASRPYSTATNQTSAFDDLNYILQQNEKKKESYLNNSKLLSDKNDTPEETPQKFQISKSSSILENAARDASSYSLKQPDICIVPANVKQVRECVRYCYENDIPMVPVGSRTGLEGGIHAMKGGVSFDMTQMKEILQVNESDLDCHVQAGLSWRELNDQIRSTGLWFPVDPGASASLGGMASTSASGTNAVKFGTMRENVINLELVIRDGELIRTAGTQCRAKKSSAGLNLTNLFVGSEGTLGVITSVRLKLHALPSCMAVATVAFPSVQGAVESVVGVMQCGLPVARIEFLDQPGVSACYMASKLPNLDPRFPMLFIELHALSESGLTDQIDLLKEIFQANQATNFNWSSKQEERTQLWKARHNLHWSILNTKPGYSSVDTDVCVPISQFPEMVARTQELIEKYQLDAPLMGHAGDGNFHSVILYDPKKSGEFEKAKALAIEMGKVAIELQGTVTGEHGVGRGKMDLIEEQFDATTLDVMYSIKKSLDPKNLFNPGKVFKTQRLE